MESQEKRPGEKIAIGATFIDVLPTGDQLVGGNVTVTVKNALTGADTTSTILVGASVQTATPVVTAQVHAGNHGEVHRVLFRTGNTVGGNQYETELLISVTNYPRTENLLTTREAIKLVGKITDNSDNAFLDWAALVASEYFRGRTRRYLTFREWTETFYLEREDDRRSVYLEEYPVHAIDSVTFKAYDGYTPDESYVDVARFSPEGRVWFPDGTKFCALPNEVVVAYRAGLITVPAEVRDACASIGVLAQRLAGSEGLKQERIGDYMYALHSLTELPAHIRGELPIARVEGIIGRYSREEVRS